jgi:hypothetical protein
MQRQLKISCSYANPYTDAAGLQASHTYCYNVTFRHNIQCPASSPIYESLPSNKSCSQLCPAPTPVLITGNNASLGQGPIQTYDFASGALLNSFLPEHSANGRGLALHGGEIYYTEHSASDDAIHVCPYGTQGSGSTTDTRTLANTWRPGVAGQDLAFYNHPVYGDLLYVLTGYPNQPPVVYMLDPIFGTALSSALISGHAQPDSDGFVVLPWGNFLINDGDGAAGITTYREYCGQSGGCCSGVGLGEEILPPGGILIDLSRYGFQDCTGVAVAPDGQSLYFLADINALDGQTVVQTDLLGNVLSFQPIGARTAPTSLEDLGVVAQ